MCYARHVWLVGVEETIGVMSKRSRRLRAAHSVLGQHLVSASLRVSGWLALRQLFDNVVVPLWQVTSQDLSPEQQTGSNGNGSSDASGSRKRGHDGTDAGTPSHTDRAMLEGMLLDAN